MKKKTSVNIEQHLLSIIQDEAIEQDRSVSYLLEKYLEKLAQEIKRQRASRSRRKTSSG